MRRDFWIGVAIGALLLCGMVYRVIHSGEMASVK